MKRLALVVAVALAISAAWWLLAPGRPGEPAPFLGYVEADTVLVAPKAGGRLAALDVAEGDTIEAGKTVFALDADAEEAAVEAARAQLDQAKAQLADLQTPRQRPEEIQVLEAQKAQAEAALELSKSELERQERLFAQKTSAQAALDQARTAYKRDQATLVGAEHQIEVAKLPGRPEQVAAAKAAAEAARASLDKARIGARRPHRRGARRRPRARDVLPRGRDGAGRPAGRGDPAAAEPPRALLRAGG